MNSSTNEPIRLSDSETEMLTRALAEAQKQAEFPTADQTETQFLRRAEADPARKSGGTQVTSNKPGNMIL